MRDSFNSDGYSEAFIRTISNYEFEWLLPKKFNSEWTMLCNQQKGLKIVQKNIGNILKHVNANEYINQTQDEWYKV